MKNSDDTFVGAEHIVDFNPESGRVHKITIPPFFGITAGVVSVKSAADGIRQTIEAIDATLIEYLDRWDSNNLVFRDDVRLSSVIRWPDGLVSTSVTQPQYHGEPARPAEIEEYFSKGGWTKLSHRFGRTLFFNYAHQILAMDAEGRNCYISQQGLQPFDVILTRPDETMEAFLKLY